MQATVRLLMMLLSTAVATLSWQQTASACGGGGDDGFALLGATIMLDIPPLVLGTGDVLMAVTWREPTRAYAVAETMLSVPALAVSTAFAVESFGPDSLFDDGARAFSLVAVALPALTLAHGIKWIRIHQRRRREGQYLPKSHAPGMQLAPRVTPYAESSRLKASLQLATMPVTDGKSIGAGVGVLGRF